MGRGKSGYVSYTALVLLCRLSGTSASIWDVSIDESPAPPPDKGPPFSANATRNIDLLPFQIIGIVGAYIGSILILGTLLLTVGRSLRKKAQEMALQPKELVQPLTKTFERTPVSPSSSRNWYSPRRMRGKISSGSMRSAQSAVASPAAESIASFDTTVIEADKLKRQQEMERLYAAVMAQDEQRSAPQPNVTALPQISTPERPPEYSTKGPPKIITDGGTLRFLQAANPNAPTPRTPKSPVRAIYPPSSNLPPGPSSPTSPIRAEYSPWPRPSPPERTHSHDREHSFGSAATIVGSSAGATSPQKKLRKSIRNLKISAPIVRVEDDDDARTPLSPRFYADPGIPPEPPTAGTSRSYGYPPTTPGTAVSQHDYGYPDGWDGDQIEEDMDEIRDLPQANPQRFPVNPYINEAQMVTDLASTRPDPSRNRAVGNGSLPLREMNRQYALQQQQAQATQQRGTPSSPAAQTATFPLSPRHWNNPTSPSHAYVTSAGPVKTTFLDVRKDARRGPQTGVPTPYSAYMPFTPVTPITPHLTTRAERKQREKDEKRSGVRRKAIVEEEAVVEEKEMWSYAY